MSTIHTWVNTLLIGGVVLAWVLVGGNQPGALSGSSDSGYNATGNGVYAVDGTTVIDGSGNVDAPITSTTGTFSGDVVVTTANTATSSIEVGCIQTYATSTASPIKVTWGKVGSTATTTLYGGTSVFLPYGEYGTCP